MLYKLEKSPIPIIWLDTWLIIKLTKLRSGQRLNPEDTARLGVLYEMLSEKVQQAKLICPVAHQREEYDPKDLAEECYKLQEDLSMGARFREPLDVMFGQMRKAIEARNAKETEVIISYNDAFATDPIQPMARRKRAQSSYVVTPWLSLFQTERLNAEGNQILAVLKERNRENGITFQQQITLERTSILQAIRKVGDDIERLNKQWPPKTFEEALEALTVLSQTQRILRPVGDLISLSGGPHEFLAFVQSDDYYNVPIVDLQSRLFAYMMTSKPALRPGDRRDFDQLSLVLPYSDIVAVDKETADALQKVHATESYPCKVYTMTNIGDLENYLERL